ncbi:cardiomyopathy-associated protein 5-like protein [Lates japonicus]|uniref:Cardiomyopathy-associated protein 5-like protein n=1 Tax=Lates japonicus TaxID=270547 RepID=A0AAD3RLK4_LATJO|nr:cardiomyopathy-associated protein 5-like protein [Lates japonicus]
MVKISQHPKSIPKLTTEENYRALNSVQASAEAEPEVSVKEDSPREYTTTPTCGEGCQQRRGEDGGVDQKKMREKLRLISGAQRSENIEDQDHAKGNAQLTPRTAQNPAPQRPTQSSQELRYCFTSTSVTVYWKVNPDIIDCFQVHCMRIRMVSKAVNRGSPQPSENYLFHIKAVNEAGASEQSEAALISTKGTRFHLLKASAHSALELSVDQTTLHYPQDTYENTPLTDKKCPSILGELLPARGHYYWETIVTGSTAYRLGVAYSTANRDNSLGENSLSWCLQCIPTPSGCRYQLLHNDVQTSVFVIEMPERVGTLLDYQLGRLSFYNAQRGQLIGTFSQRFTQPCHPALALEMPGSLEVSMVPEVPEFIKDS